MTEEPVIRACIIPNLNTRFLELDLDANDQYFLLYSFRESASFENRAELLVDTNIENKIKDNIVPIALRKRAMCERLEILKTTESKKNALEKTKSESKPDITSERKKGLSFEISIKNPMPIIRRKFLLYQWSLAS